MSDLTAAGFAWIVLSILSTVSITVGFYLPYWIVGSIQLNGRRTAVYFGSFRRCNYPIFDQTLKHFRMENRCGRYATFADIPSIFWQIATVSIGLGCVLSLILSFILIPSCCLKHLLSKNSAILVGLLQVVSAIGVSCGCVIYPLGWDNPEIQDACGLKASPYVLGDCTLGWAYLCMLAGSALTLLCGTLSICSIKGNNGRSRQIQFHHLGNGGECQDLCSRTGSSQKRRAMEHDSRTLINMHSGGREFECNNNNNNNNINRTLPKNHKSSLTRLR